MGVGDRKCAFSKPEWWGGKPWARRQGPRLLKGKLEGDRLPSPASHSFYFVDNILIAGVADSLGKHISNVDKRKCSEEAKWRPII